MGRSALQLHQEGVELANRGELRSAQRVLTRASALTDDPDLAARISATLAVTYARTGDLVRAESLCTEVWASPDLRPATRALVAGQMGTIAQLAGRLGDAERWISLAISSVEDPIVRATLLQNRSYIGMQRRDLLRARSDTAEAARLYAAHSAGVDAAEARHDLGYIDLLRGDLVGALTQMTDARPTLAAASRAGAAVSDADRAEVLRDAGLIREAEELLVSAATIFGSIRMKLERARAEYALARSLLSHDPVRASAVAARAARRFRLLSNEAWTMRADALVLRARLAAGQIVSFGRRVPEAGRAPRAADVETLARALESGGLRNDAVALRLSFELWTARHGRSSTYPSATRVPGGASMDVRLLAHEVRAARAQQRGRQSEVRAYARAGLDELFGWQRQFGSLDLQTSVVWHGHGLVGLGLQSAVQSGRPDVVFEWSERARHLSLQVVPLRPPPDPDLAAELAELRMLRADGDGWLSNPRAVELHNSARRRQWASTRSAAVRHRATLEEAQLGLDDSTAVVAYVYSGETLSALIVKRDSAQLVDLGDWGSVRQMMSGLRGDLDMAAVVQRGPLAAVVRRSLDDRLSALSSALVAPVLRAVDDRRLVITAPGVLSGVPWAMLPALHGRVFTLAASASRWLSFARDVPRPGAAAFAAGPRVPRAAEEVSAASGAWRDPVVLDPARIEEVTRAAAAADVLHIAAHGRHSADNPMFSGLELADGTLFGYDIDLIENVPDTIVLSACEVGRSSVRWGEEAVGMTRVWLHAGARCVVAAPVVVADDDACELLAAMHEGLAAGIPPSVALADASARTGIVAPFQVHGAGF
ncbi:CHAT domain-containing protein [Microbacterium sp. NPDC058389]|uniref:CHAT domain-containing protein n=1 Tax=Microbacterium sp. NPDC058389 TaxID=3346475 RepID=UPI003658E262